MKKIFCSIPKGFERYLDWIDELPGALGAIILFTSVVIPTVLVANSIFSIVNTNHENQCLDSLKPRRFHDLTCEEYIDSNWIEINPYNENITYKYNGPASRMKE
jgi:hypothetical protein